MGNLFWLVGDMQGNRRETGDVKKKKKAVTSWVLEDLQESGQQGPQDISPTRTCVYARAHRHTDTHTHLYRYWPDVQDVPIKKAESNFRFLLCENPNQDRPHCFLTPVGISG